MNAFMQFKHIVLKSYETIENLSMISVHCIV